METVEQPVEQKQVPESDASVNEKKQDTAGFSKRFVNFLFDGLYERIAIVLVIFLLAITYGLIGNVFKLPAPKITQPYDTVIAIVITFAIYFAYYYYFEFHFGKTPGKYISSTKVAMQDGSKLTPDAVTKRTLLRLLPLEVFSGFFNDQRLFWHDKYSGTMVVNDPENHTKLGTILGFLGIILFLASIVIGSMLPNQS